MRFILPLRVQQSKNKKFSCNLNLYRSAHYQVLNNAKVEFARIFEEQYGYSKNKPIERCELHYTIYWPDKRLSDLDNVGSIIAKFTGDCLTKYNYIIDDNRTVVKRIVFTDGGIDRNNPRAELELVERIKHV